MSPEFKSTPCGRINCSILYITSISVFFSPSHHHSVSVVQIWQFITSSYYASATGCEISYFTDYSYSPGRACPCTFTCQRVRIQICVHTVMPVNSNMIFFVENLSRSFGRCSALSAQPGPSKLQFTLVKLTTSRYITVHPY